MKQRLTNLLGAHIQLIGVLLGALLVSLSMGTYTNWDAQLEFEAASNVVTRSFPYVTTGLMINQPPLGFYLDAPVFHALGLSYLNGVGAMTAFGLGCVALVYALGTMLYGKRTGLVAAALFGIVPWHVYMLKNLSHRQPKPIFQPPLFGRLGFWLSKKILENSCWRRAPFFALAFLTKLFAVFMLAPFLLMVYLQGKQFGFKITARKVLIFLSPTFVLQAIWFGGFANQNFSAVYFSSDFTHPVLVANPSLLFLPIISC